MTAVCAVAFTVGALFPGRFTAPIVAVGITIVALVAFRQAVDDNGGSRGAIGVLSPDGAVPGNDWGLFNPVSVGVPIVQVMFMGGVVLAAAGVLGLSPRTGGVGWRGALSAVAAGGARLRTVAVSAFAVGVALAAASFILAETANVSDATSTLQIPAIDEALSGSNPIPYTPACSAGPGSFQVCVHPAYQPYLPWVAGALGPVIAQVSGLPGGPTSARELPASQLPQAVRQGFAKGQIAGRSYEFSLSNAIGFSPTPSMVKDSLQQDLMHAIIVGSAGEFDSKGFQPNPGTLAQQAVVNGLLKALGTPPFTTKQVQVTAAAARFAALPASTRHAWLVRNLTALKAGAITVAQLP
jgi:hypothetical protein